MESFDAYNPDSILNRALHTSELLKFRVYYINWIEHTPNNSKCPII